MDDFAEGYLPAKNLRYYEAIKCQEQLIVSSDLVGEYEPNWDKLRGSALSGRWKSLHRMARTLQVFTPGSEI
jgi:hypothetical protein